MNLKSPAFEKALRGKVRAEIRRSPALKRERKRVRRRQIKLPSALGHLLVAVVAFGILVGSHTRSQALAAGLLAFLGTALLFHHAVKLRVSLFADPALLIFDSLPLSSEQVFRHQWRQFTGETIRFSLYFIVAYLGFGLFFGFGPAQFAGALLIAGLQWLLIYSASAQMLARWPGCRFEVMHSMLVTPAFLLFIAAVILRERSFPLIEPLVLPLSWITPSGWLNSLFLHGVVNGDWLWFALVIPVALIGATLPSSRRRLLEMHRAREPVYFRWPEVTAEEAWDMPASAPGYAGLLLPTRSGPTAIEDAIRERSFLPEPKWPKAGLLEHWVARWLTPREKAVADFMFLYAPGWTVGWKRAAKCLAIALPLSLILARLGNMWLPVGFIVSGSVIGLAALPISDLNWWGFRSAQVGTVGTPLHAFFPFSYGEIARVLFKASAVRVGASLPLLATLGAVGAWHYGKNAGWGALLGCNFAVMFLSLNPMLVALSFSRQTSDYKPTTLRTWIFVPPFLFGMILVVVLAVVQLVILWVNPQFKETLILPPVIAALSYALFRWHRFAYDRCWFDTLKLTPSSA